MLKDIPNFEGWYQASEDGQIYSLKAKKFLSQQLKGIEGKEYYYVGLCKNNHKTSHRVNRLIAETFIPNPDNLPIVNHIDGNKLNNCVDNLEWCDYTYNNNYDDRIEKSVVSRIQNGHCVKTAMCDKETHEIIQIFDTTSQAIQFLNLNKSASSNISATIRGRKKSAYGYWWTEITEDL